VHSVSRENFSFGGNCKARDYNKLNQGVDIITSFKLCGENPDRVDKI
jgi:hypothetical protein